MPTRIQQNSAKRSHSLPIVRRRIVAAAIGSPFFVSATAQGLTPSDIGLLPPPALTVADYVRMADLIFVGAIEKIVFRGNDFVASKEEYNKDFAGDGDSGTRSMDAFVRVKHVLKSALDFKVPVPLRIQRPVPREHIDSYIGQNRIFLARENMLLQAGNPASRLFLSITDALEMSEESAVRHLIANHGPAAQR